VELSRSRSSNEWFHAPRNSVWVAQTSGLSFPASRRKPFVTAIIVSITANPHTTSPHEIWRDAKFNRRDACSTHNHTGGILA
jgi:hypothetical protein